MNNNEMYVMKQPEHTVFSIIVMDTGFPISKACHGFIEILQRVSDTCFIFSDSMYQSSNVNKKKFTSLYEGNCFINLDYNNNSILPVIIKALSYSVEIFGKHYSYLIMNLSDLGKFSEKQLEKLLANVMRINMSDIRRPILTINRLSREDMYLYYRKEPMLDSNDCVSKVLDPISSKLRNFLLVQYDKQENNMYSAWRTDSKAQFFRKSTIIDCLEFLDKNPKFICSFDGNRIDELFATLIKRLNIKIHNTNVEDLELGEKM